MNLFLIKRISSFSQLSLVNEGDFVVFWQQNSQHHTINLESESTDDSQIIKSISKQFTKHKNNIFFVPATTEIIGIQESSVLVFKGDYLVGISSQIKPTQEFDGSSILPIYENKHCKFAVLIDEDILDYDLLRILNVNKVDFIIHFCYNTLDLQTHFAFYSKTLKSTIISVSNEGILLGTKKQKFLKDYAIINCYNKKNNFVARKSCVKALQKIL